MKYIVNRILKKKKRNNDNKKKLSCMPAMGQIQPIGSKFDTRGLHVLT